MTAVSRMIATAAFAALLLVAGRASAGGESKPTVTLVSSKGAVTLQVTVARTPESWSDGPGVTGALREGEGLVLLFPRVRIQAFTARGLALPADAIGIDETGHVAWIMEDIAGDRFRASPVPVAAILFAHGGLCEELSVSRGNLLRARGFSLRPKDRAREETDGLDEALEALTRSAKANATDPDALLELGAFLTGVQEASKAIPTLRKALAMEESPRAHAALGDALMSLGEREKAEEHYRAAVRIDPGFVPAFGKLSLIMRRRGDADEIEALLLDTIERDPDLLEARLALARLRMSAGDWGAARSALEPALADRSKRPDAMRVLGDIELRQGNTLAAADAYIEYLEAYPSAPHAAELRAFILVHKAAVAGEKGGER